MPFIRRITAFSICILHLQNPFASGNHHLWEFEPQAEFHVYAFIGVCILVAFVATVALGLAMRGAL